MYLGKFAIYEFEALKSKVHKFHMQPDHFRLDWSRLRYLFVLLKGSRG